MMFLLKLKGGERMKKKLVSLLAVALLLAICLGTVLPYVSAARPNKKRSRRPRFTIRIDRRVVPSGETFDTWLYVTNPSRNMETQQSDSGRMPVHVVEVESLEITIVRMSDGEISPFGGTYTPSDLPQRWDPIVYPGERSLVFFVGWALVEKDYWEPGAFEFTYTLEVTFEGENFELTRTFIIWVICVD